VAAQEPKGDYRPDNGFKDGIRPRFLPAGIRGLWPTSDAPEKAGRTCIGQLALKPVFRSFGVSPKTFKTRIPQTYPILWAGWVQNVRFSSTHGLR
jgi:hypothetical protein